MKKRGLDIMVFANVGRRFYAKKGLFATHLVRKLMATASDHSVAFVTCPNEEVAKNIARGLVEKKLAACVNIIPNLTSVYVWEGKVEEDSEVLLKIKTRTSVVGDLTSYVRSNHPNDVAEVISFKIDQGNEPYLKWMLDVVTEPKR